MIALGNCFTFNIIVTTNYRDTYINLYSLVNYYLLLILYLYNIFNRPLDKLL